MFMINNPKPDKNKTLLTIAGISKIARAGNISQYPPIAKRTTVVIKKANIPTNILARRKIKLKTLPTTDESWNKGVKSNFHINPAAKSSSKKSIKFFQTFAKKTMLSGYQNLIKLSGNAIYFILLLLNPLRYQAPQNALIFLQQKNYIGFQASHQQAGGDCEQDPKPNRASGHLKDR